MRYRLRTLLIVLALAPPVLAGWWLNISKNTDRLSVIALIVCLLIGFGAAIPVLVAWTRQRN